jgi:hypothetical protein
MDDEIFAQLGDCGIRSRRPARQQQGKTNRKSAEISHAAFVSYQNYGAGGGI